MRTKNKFNEIAKNAKDTTKYITVDDYGYVYQSITEPWTKRDIRDKRIWYGDETFEFMGESEKNSIELYMYSPDHKYPIEEYRQVFAVPFKKRDKLANLLGLYLGSPIKCTLGRGTLKCVCIYDDEMQTIIVEIEKEEHEISLTELDKYQFKLILKEKLDEQSLIETSIKNAIKGININIMPEEYYEIEKKNEYNWDWVGEFKWLNITGGW